MVVPQRDLYEFILNNLASDSLVFILKGRNSLASKLGVCTLQLGSKSCLTPVFVWPVSAEWFWEINICSRLKIGSTNLESQLSKNVILPQKNSILLINGLSLKTIVLSYYIFNFINIILRKLCSYARGTYITSWILASLPAKCLNVYHLTLDRKKLAKPYCK